MGNHTVYKYKILYCLIMIIVEKYVVGKLSK